MYRYSRLFRLIGRLIQQICTALNEEMVTLDQTPRSLEMYRHNVHLQHCVMTHKMRVTYDCFKGVTRLGMLVKYGSLARSSTVQVRLKMEQRSKRARYMAGAHGCTHLSCICITTCCGQLASSLDWTVHTSSASTAPAPRLQVSAHPQLHSFHVWLHLL